VQRLIVAEVLYAPALRSDALTRASAAIPHAGFEAKISIMAKEKKINWRLCAEKLVQLNPTN
jgi:hypothetical protein